MQMRLILHRAVPLVVLALTAACSLDATPVAPTVTPTPTATATAAVTPTPTHTPAPPTATPTPTIVPQVALAAAERDRLNGDYVASRDSYRLVLAQGDSAPDEARIDAAFGLGQAALRDGQFDDAVEPLSELITAFAGDDRIARAYALRGDAYLGLGHWQEAIADFEQYLSLNPDLIDSYIYERIGDACLGMGAAEDALESYMQAINASRSLVTQLALRERAAQVYAALGATDAALAQVDAIIASTTDTALLARVQLLAAQTLQTAGQDEVAANRLRRIVEAYPRQPEAYVALQALLADGYEVEALQHARVAFAYGDYTLTAKLLHDYTTRYQLAAVPPELYMLLGRAYRELGNTDAAVVAFQTVVEQFPRDPLFGDALLEQARAREQANDVSGAIAAYTRIVTNYSYLPQAAEALWHVAYLSAVSDQPTEARAAFEQLAQAFPNTFQARSGLFLAGGAAVAGGDLATAERLYGLLAVSATGEAQAAAYLNAGRLGQLRGDTRFANDSLNRAVAAAPASYYAARAQDILNGQAMFAPPSVTRFETGDDEVAAAEDWLREWFTVDQTGPLAVLSPALAADARLISGQALWALAAYDQARVEFADLVTAYQNDGVASYQLAVFLRDLGAYRDSIVAAANVVRAAGAGTLDVPVAISRLRYPAYYIDLIEQAADEYDLDPLLLLSLIRHASLFDRQAVGTAGEKGLLQMSAGTAVYVADQLAWPDFEPVDLFQPNVSIPFGAFYLAEQMARFDGHVVAALAAYDAGAERAETWYALSGGDPDLMMTAITETRTQTFVQRVYSYYNVYRVLYGAALEGNAAAP